MILSFCSQLLLLHTRHINVYCNTSICCCCCCCCCCCIRRTLCLEKVPPEDSTPTCSFESPSLSFIYMPRCLWCSFIEDTSMLLQPLAWRRSVGCLATGYVQHTSIYSSFIDINIKIILYIGMNGLLLEATPYLCFPPYQQYQHRGHATLWSDSSNRAI
jgi:hypothetical protein